MEYILYLIFALIPVSGILLCFMKDNNHTRRTTLNILLIANTLLFLSPFIYAFLMTFPDGNMWSENGQGAVFWYYFILLPACLIIQLILFIAKIMARPKEKIES